MNPLKNHEFLEKNSVILVDKTEVLKVAEKYEIQLIGFTPR